MIRTVLPTGLVTVRPTEANAQAYVAAYKLLPRADRRRIDRQAKRAVKRYGKAKPTRF